MDTTNIKVGETVICIDNNGYDGRLTEGKTYQVVDDEFNHRDSYGFSVEDDKGDVVWAYSYRWRSPTAVENGQYLGDLSVKEGYVVECTNALSDLFKVGQRYVVLQAGSRPAIRDRDGDLMWETTSRFRIVEQPQPIQHLNVQVGDYVECVGTDGTEFTKGNTYRVEAFEYTDGEVVVRSDLDGRGIRASSSTFRKVDAPEENVKDETPELPGQSLDMVTATSGDDLLCVHAPGSWWVEGKVYNVYEDDDGDDYIYDEDGTRWYTWEDTAARFELVTPEPEEFDPEADDEVIGERFCNLDTDDGDDLLCTEANYHWWTEGKLYRVTGSMIIDDEGDRHRKSSGGNGALFINVTKSEGQADGPVKSDGGATSYYELPSHATELRHLISAKGMSKSRGDIFKACFRLGEKDGTDIEYDLNKLEFFVQDLKEMYARGERL